MQAILFSGIQATGKSQVAASILRNAGRPLAERIPERGIRGASARLELVGSCT